MFDAREVPLELPLIDAAVCTGILLGGLYFGGLWWTVGRMPRARNPLNLYFSSLIVRLAFVLAAFIGVLSYSGWPQLVAALVGFVAARLVLICLIGRTPCSEMSPREAV